MYQKDFRKLLLFYFSFIWLTIFSRSILPPHYLSQGLSFKVMFAGTSLAFLGQIILLLIYRQQKARNTWRMALIAWVVFLLLIIKIYNPWQFYLAMVLSGLSSVLFYLSYNIAHFKQTHKTKRVKVLVLWLV